MVRKVLQLEELGTFFAYALPIVSDIESVNARLTEAGRPDLAITDQARMMEIVEPADIPKRCNNFTPNFHFYTDRRETGDLDWRNEPATELIPATREEILALKDVPKFASYDEFADMADSRKFPALSRNGNHGNEPAFTRMIILFPEFASSLAVDMSTLEDRRRYAKFEDRLYVAYQLMSRLVDKLDPHVLNKDGGVEERHLCK